MEEVYLIGSVFLICSCTCQALTKGTSWRGTLIGMALGLLVGAYMADGSPGIGNSHILSMFLFSIVNFGTLGTAADASLRRHAHAWYCWIFIVICICFTATVPQVD